MKTPQIGFIGQGWIGKNYADDFENRGYSVVRYALEAPYNQNKDKLKECDLVFIAVPTPTTPQGFDDSVVRSVLPLVGDGKVAVIKSTLLVGRTKDIQKEFPHCVVVHAPEFLSENTAAHDAAHPDRNIIGIPEQSEQHKDAAALIMSVLPKAVFDAVCSSEEAELIKYAHNVHGYLQVVFSNILYDITQNFKGDWNVIVNAIKADPFMNHRYLRPVDKNGRGAGGGCFVKDFEAFIEHYRNHLNDPIGTAMLESIRNKNINLLVASGKSVETVKQVYGNSCI